MGRAVRRRSARRRSSTACSTTPSHHDQRPVLPPTRTPRRRAQQRHHDRDLTCVDPAALADRPRPRPPRGRSRPTFSMNINRQFRCSLTFGAVSRTPQDLLAPMARGAGKRESPLNHSATALSGYDVGNADHDASIAGRGPARRRPVAVGMRVAPIAPSRRAPTIRRSLVPELHRQSESRKKASCCEVSVLPAR
jgi:hypothetical protein